MSQNGRDAVRALARGLERMVAEGEERRLKVATQARTTAQAMVASKPIHGLPASYENAKAALAACASIDECQTWADKAAALASYHKQARDEELMKMAVRIRDRAIRRAGELLKQIEPGQGARDGKRADAGDSPLTRTQAARDAGMSERQQVTAVRVANVPAADFERQVESANPPTVTALAEQGKRPVPAPAKPIIDLKGRDPEEFNRALHFVADFERYARDLAALDVEGTLPLLEKDEVARVRSAIAVIEAYHRRILEGLRP